MSALGLFHPLYSTARFLVDLATLILMLFCIQWDPRLLFLPKYTPLSWRRVGTGLIIFFCFVLKTRTDKLMPGCHTTLYLSSRIGISCLSLKRDLENYPILSKLGTWREFVGSGAFL